MKEETQKNYQVLASAILARENCIKANNEEWKEKHEETIERIMKTAPYGSGIDNGTTLDIEKSTSEKLYFNFSFHFMNEAGFYDGWENYTLIVKPSLAFDIDLRLIGKNRDDIKEYLYDVYYSWLTEEVED